MKDDRAFLKIPDKILVGYKNREDTFSGRLAFITYMSGGKISKEVSWTKWRDKSIPSDEFDNTPTSGFVINKSVGGYNYGYFRKRGEWVRIHDPRGFEFELSVSNLIYLVQECDITHGELAGEFIYSWDGSDLVLLPVGSSDYVATKEMEAARASASLSWKTMDIGTKYSFKYGSSLYYIGKHKLKVKDGYRGVNFKVNPYHLFWNSENKTIYREDNIKNILYPAPGEEKLSEHELEKALVKLNSLPCAWPDKQIDGFEIPVDKHAQSEFDRIFKDRKLNTSLYKDSIHVAKLSDDKKTIYVHEYSIDSKGDIYEYSSCNASIKSDGSLDVTYPTYYSKTFSLSQAQIKNIIDTTLPLKKEQIGFKIGDAVVCGDLFSPPYPVSYFSTL